jgi:hypothetical protein
VAGVSTFLIAIGGFFVPAIFNIEENHHKNIARIEDALETI